MRISTRDLVKILRAFNKASQDDSSRQIDQVTKYLPQTTNEAIRFRFNKKFFIVLIDDQANDNEAYVLSQLQIVKSDLTGQLLHNPISVVEAYGYPYRGKDIYLYQEISPKKRLDHLLTIKYPNFNRSTLQKFIRNGHVTVNGQPVVKASAEFNESDSFAIAIPELDYTQPTEISTIYVDDNLIVINKPIGVLTHAKGVFNEELTVADFLKSYLDHPDESNRSGIVHRLDRETSGVLVGARNKATETYLKERFAKRQVQKTYIAIVEGTPKHPKATIDVPLARNPSAHGTFRPDPNGKSAKTDYLVLATIDGKSLILLRPFSGRTHQLRVHMSYLGTPILGDKIYGKSSDRMYLHAYSLELTDLGDKNHRFIAPIPEEFYKYFDKSYYERLDTKR